FLNKVSEYRNLPAKKVREIAQGRVWSGKEAVKIGLVDQIGGLETAIAYAAEEAKLDKDWQIEEYPQRRNWENELLQRFTTEQTINNQDKITMELMKLKEELAVFQTLNDPRNIYARMFFEFLID
nr:S49 family peptidase [Xenococcaceae cyanobacterium MO_188.B19]